MEAVFIAELPFFPSFRSVQNDRRGAVACALTGFSADSLCPRGQLRQRSGVKGVNRSLNGF